MLKKNIITHWQAILLVIFSSISTAVFFVPGGIVAIVNQDAWLAVLLGTLLSALLIYYPLAVLSMRYPGMTIIQYSEKIMGKFPGKFIGAILVYYFFQHHCWTLREFGDIVAVFLPETPMMVFLVAFSIVTTYAVYSGLEVIGRCAELILPAGIFSLVIIIISNIGKMDFSKILPIMEGGVPSLLWAASIPIQWLATGFVIYAFTPEINSRSIIKISLTAVGIAGLILTLFSFVNITVFGTSVLERLTFPLLELARYGPYSTEVLVVVSWIALVFIRTALYSYATVLSISQLFRLTSHRFLTPTETILAIAYSVYQYDNYIEQSYLFNTATFYYLSLYIGLPLTLWIVSNVRSKLR